ncbi:gamma-aminobutyric acid type B receptor subunit 2-like [Strongylocentrotus purpuratus]|uniref:G-protein coupled receptors family 3 profile domain-containing protein n=1 Tax=Strongylocentrotus purpuratus TaxID=7668 RepID=A0A7M7PN09_STRPU|nr:gamma-aminobutyric acid type B receptor subunit 2-like [Strongylocentrotus purpuratus]
MRKSRHNSVEQILVFDRIEDSIRWKRRFEWGGTIIPVSGPTYRPTPVAIGNVNRSVIYVTGSLGIVLALSFLAANIHFRNERVVKISSPVLNNVIAIGCILLYGSTFLLNETLQIHTSYSHVMISIQCQGTLIVGCIGLSLSFGALFVKTYRIHQIYTSAMKARAVRGGLGDGRLLFTLSIFVIIDLAFFIFWMTFDPMVLRSRTFAPTLDLEVPALEIWFVPTLRACSSKHVVPFLITLLVYKGALLLFGVFLAWSTRNVRISQLNDSKPNFDLI